MFGCVCEKTAELPEVVVASDENACFALVLQFPSSVETAREQLAVEVHQILSGLGALLLFLFFSFLLLALFVGRGWFIFFLVLVSAAAFGFGVDGLIPGGRQHAVLLEGREDIPHFRDCIGLLCACVCMCVNENSDLGEDKVTQNIGVDLESFDGIIQTGSALQLHEFRPVCACVCVCARSRHTS